MNTISTAPIGTLFTCQYTSSNPRHADEPSYLVAGIVVTEGYDNSKRWKALLGGWSCAKCNLTKNNKLPTEDLIL